MVRPKCKAIIRYQNFICYNHQGLEKEGISPDGEATMSKFKGNFGREEMNNSIIGLVGASGFGSEVLPLLENQIKAQGDFEGDLVLIDSDRSEKKIIWKEYNI